MWWGRSFFFPDSSNNFLNQHSTSNNTLDDNTQALQHLIWLQMSVSYIFIIPKWSSQVSKWVGGLTSPPWYPAVHTKIAGKMKWDQLISHHYPSYGHRPLRHHQKKTYLQSAIPSMFPRSCHGFPIFPKSFHHVFTMAIDSPLEELRLCLRIGQGPLRRPQNHRAVGVRHMCGGRKLKDLSNDSSVSSSVSCSILGGYTFVLWFWGLYTLYFFMVEAYSNTHEIHRLSIRMYSLKIKHVSVTWCYMYV